MNNVYNSDSNEIKFRIPNYKASNTTSEERRCSDYNVVL